MATFWSVVGYFVALCLTLWFFFSKPRLPARLPWVPSVRVDPKTALEEALEGMVATCPVLVQPSRIRQQLQEHRDHWLDTLTSLFEAMEGKLRMAGEESGIPLAPALTRNTSRGLPALLTEKMDAILRAREVMVFEALLWALEQDDTLPGRDDLMGCFAPWKAGPALLSGEAATRHCGFWPLQLAQSARTVEEFVGWIEWLGGVGEMDEDNIDWSGVVGAVRKRPALLDCLWHPSLTEEFGALVLLAHEPALLERWVQTVGATKTRALVPLWMSHFPLSPSDDAPGLIAAAHHLGLPLFEESTREGLCRMLRGLLTRQEREESIGERAAEESGWSDVQGLPADRIEAIRKNVDTEVFRREVWCRAVLATLDIDAPHLDGWTFLQAMVVEGRLPAVALLLGAGASPLVEKEGLRPLALHRLTQSLSVRWPIRGVASWPIRSVVRQEGDEKNELIALLEQAELEAGLGKAVQVCPKDHRRL